MDRTLIVPSVSRRTVKGNSAVVVIGVDGRRVGDDNGALGGFPFTRRSDLKNRIPALRGSGKFGFRGF
jgi:hypothetical protein